MRVGLLTTAIFGNLSGYFFGTSEIRPAILYDEMSCCAVTDCKMNDLEWLYHVKLGFCTRSFSFRRSEFEA